MVSVEHMVRPHPWQDLRGEALDNHLRTLHGWTEQMLSQRGAEANVDDQMLATYAWHMHRNAHDNFDIEQRLAERGQR